MKKIVLKKTVVANLSNDAMNSLKGGNGTGLFLTVRPICAEQKLPATEAEMSCDGLCPFTNCC